MSDSQSQWIGRLSRLLPSRVRERVFEPASEELRQLRLECSSPSMIGRRAATIAHVARVLFVWLDCYRIAFIDSASIERPSDLAEPGGKHSMALAGQDLRFAVRLLWKQPVFTLAVVLTLAVGIGANSALFSIVYSVLLRPLPYSQSERLVAVRETNEKGRPTTVAPLNFLDWRARSTSFEALAAYEALPTTLNRAEQSQRVVAYRASADLFPILRIRALYGRVFHETDDRYGAPRVALLSHDLWQRDFGADPSVIGQIVRFDSEPTTIIGVLPAGLAFPEKTDVWFPLALGPREVKPNNRGAHYLSAIARLKDGIAVEQASAEMDSVAGSLAREYVRTNAGTGVRIQPLLTWIVGSTRPALLLLFSAVGFVLLIACVNVSHLMLARAGTRRAELAIRAALGAGRVSLLRQLLIEAVVLSLAGATLGVAFAWWSLDLVVAMAPGDLPRLDQVAIDGTVLAFTFGLSVLTGLVFGLAPALHGLRSDAGGLLKGLRRDRGDVRGRTTRGALVGCEVALALMLLVAAGLTATSFVRLTEVDLGFDASRVLTFRVALPAARYPDAASIDRFFGRLITDIGAQPGVRSASAVMQLPLDAGGFGGSFTAGGDTRASQSEEPNAQIRPMTADYLRTLNIPLTRGRGFTEQDGRTGHPVAIVSETVAREYWPGADPIGRSVQLHISLGEKESAREIVGVVKDVSRNQIGAGPSPIIYVPHSQYTADEMAVVVRMDGDPMAMAPMLRSRLQAFDRELAASGVQALDDQVASSLAPARFRSILLILFALVALGLAMLGLYGVMAYSVNERTHEIGLRMALGARRNDVLRLIVAQGMLPVALGLVVGLIGAAGMTRVMSTLLFGVSALDPATYATVSFVLAVSACLGCYIPVRRALNVDPLTALRDE